MLKKFNFVLLFFIVSYIFIISSNSTSNFLTKDANSNVKSPTYTYPCKTTYITSNYGYRELYGKQNFHNGIDFGESQNNYVYSIASGVIIHAGFLNGYGNCVTILHANGYKSLYAHLSEDFLVSNGKHVLQGEIIGKVGPKYLSNGVLNGYTTGPHLQLTIFDENSKTINPLLLLNK